MKLYCFLLLIILLCLLYDNNLYEGNNGEYDTSEDRTGIYDNSPVDTSGFLSFLNDLGLYGYIADYLPDVPVDTTCNAYKDITCTELNYTGDWSYGDTDGEFCSPILDSEDDNCVASPSREACVAKPKCQYNSGSASKKKCMKCFKCKNKGLFIDQFYANMCDSMNACYTDKDVFINEDNPKLAYVYAYNNTYSVGKDDDNKDYCSQNGLNAAQISICKLLSENTTLDTLLIPKKPASALCHTEIYTEEVEDDVLNLL